MNYLYNGKELPDIYSVYTPELQKSHPFATIIGGTRSFLIFSDYRMAFNEMGHWAVVNVGPAKRYQLKDGSIDGGWALHTEYVEGDCLTPFIGNIVWANFDIYNEDNTLYLAASEPVPVSPVQINPALLVQSFFTGQAIRRNRT